MKQLERLDEDTPIDAYQGFIGVTMDHHDLFAASQYSILKSFDWDDFFSEINEEEVRTYSIKLSTGLASIFVNNESTLAELLDQVPSVDVFYDTPENQGPGSATFHIFIEADSSSHEKIVGDITRLIQAFKQS
jgi:hypothetical protein